MWNNDCQQPIFKNTFLPVPKVFFFVVMREISSSAVAFFVTPRTSSNAFRCCWGREEDKRARGLRLGVLLEAPPRATWERGGCQSWANGKAIFAVSQVLVFGTHSPLLYCAVLVTSCMDHPLGFVHLIPSRRGIHRGWKGLRGILTCLRFNPSQHRIIRLNSLATEQS